MTFLRAPSIETSADLTTERRTPSLRPPHGHDVCDGMHGLPEGSSLFREVMAELQPPSPNPFSPPCRSPNPRRRKSLQVKHVHYTDQAKRNEGSSPKPNEAEAGAEEEEEPAGPERQILHGKCHCYFVENGNVTGLADHHCQHEHRLQLPAQLSPLSSPRPSRRLSPTTTTPTSSSTPTPEGSPTSRRKHHHQPHHHNNHNHHHHHHHHNSRLQPPPEGLSRGRSNSDVGPAGLGRVSSAKRTSLSPSPSPTTNTHRRKASTSNLHSSPNRGGGGGSGGGGGGSGAGSGGGSGAGSGGGGGSSPDKERPSAGVHRRSWSARHAERQLSDGVASSLRVSPSPHPLPHLPPPPILVQDTSEPGGGGGDRDASRVQPGGEGGRGSARRLSTHAVASDQLHYLYDQFLTSGASGASASSSSGH